MYLGDPNTPEPQTSSGSHISLIKVCIYTYYHTIHILLMPYYIYTIYIIFYTLFIT